MHQLLSATLKGCSLAQCSDNTNYCINRTQIIALTDADAVLGEPSNPPNHLLAKGPAGHYKTPFQQ